MTGAACSSGETERICAANAGRRGNIVWLASRLYPDLIYTS